MAASIEDSPWVDNQARRVNLSSDHAFGLNLHTAPRKNHPVEVSRDNHPVSLDLPLNLCIFAQDNGLFGNDISLHVPVDAKRPRKRQRAFQRHTLIDESCPLFAVPIFR